MKGEHDDEKYIMICEVLHWGILDQSYVYISLVIYIK